MTFSGLMFSTIRFVMARSNSRGTSASPRNSSIMFSDLFFILNIIRHEYNSQTTAPTRLPHTGQNTAYPFSNQQRVSTIRPLQSYQILRHPRADLQRSCTNGPTHHPPRANATLGDQLPNR